MSSEKFNGYNEWKQKWSTRKRIQLYRHWTVQGGHLIATVTIYCRGYNSSKMWKLHLTCCRKTAVITDATRALPLERWWAMSWDHHTSRLTPTRMVHPTLLHPRCQHSLFNQWADCCSFLSMASSQPYACTSESICVVLLSRTSWRCRNLSAGPWDGGGMLGCLSPLFLLLLKLSCSVLFLCTPSASHSQGSVTF